MFTGASMALKSCTATTAASTPRRSRTPRRLQPHIIANVTEKWRTARKILIKRTFANHNSLNTNCDGDAHAITEAQHRPFGKLVLKDVNFRGGYEYHILAVILAFLILVRGAGAISTSVSLLTIPPEMGGYGRIS